MGFDQKYVRLVLRLLERQVARGEGRPRLFEIGYGSGVLLKEVRDFGYDVGGIEVSAAMRERAVRAAGRAVRRADCWWATSGSSRPTDLPGPPTLVYWNDVLEHVPVDEAAEYLAHIHELLAPRGQLVTITPNWLMRPSDVTGDFCPPRTEARGLHLKEYRLAEVMRLLKRAGFRRVATPLATTSQRVRAVRRRRSAGEAACSSRCSIGCRSRPRGSCAAGSRCRARSRRSEALPSSG